MHVLMAVLTESLRSATDMRVLDGGSLCAHLWVLRGRLALHGVSCPQSQLALGARCVAKVLLQTTPRLVEVRAP